MALKYDPEFAAATEQLFQFLASAPQAAVGDIATKRALSGPALTAMILSMGQDTPDVEQTIHHVKADDGFEIPVYRFSKKGTGSKPTSAILHAHGGGMIIGSVEMFAPILKNSVAASGIPIFSVDYRLAPENPHPTSLVEDTYAGLAWLVQHAKDFNVDPARIIVMGESAGGGIAAGVTLMARDRKLEPPIAKQILIYPMLDDKNTVPNPELVPFAFWSYDDNITGWGALLGKEVGKDGVSPYAAPARVESVAHLPSTYIDVGGLDIFRDEDSKYASRLAAANIPIEFHLYPGLPHGFEALAPNVEASQQAQKNRLKAIMSV